CRAARAELRRPDRDATAVDLRALLPVRAGHRGHTGRGGLMTPEGGVKLMLGFRVQQPPQRYVVRLHCARKADRQGGLPLVQSDDRLVIPDFTQVAACMSKPARAK